MRKTAAWPGLGLAASGLLALAATTANAQPARLALVLGNGSYEAADLSAAPACPAMSRRVGEALRQLGYTVTERSDLSRGAMDAAIAGFGRALKEAPGAVAVAYVCGHVAGLNGRPFLLPVSAALQREADVLTQGVPARALVDAMQRNGATAGLVAYDLLPRPGLGEAQAAFVPLAEAAAAGPVGIVAGQAAAGAAETPLGQAMAAGLVGPRVVLAGLLEGLRQAMPAERLVALAVPPGAALLAGAADPPPAPPPVLAAAPAAPPVPVAAPRIPAPPAPAQAAPAPPPPAPPVPAPPPAPPQAAPPLSPLPDEAGLNDAQRRQVQGALGQLGYYVGEADGVFGSNTRAAIRRYQHELAAPMTGILTAAQVTRLLRGR